MRTYLIFLVILVFACEIPVRPNLPDEDRQLVVYSFFNPRQPVYFEVFNTVDILESSSFARVDEVVIDLYENDVLVETISAFVSGSYPATTFAQPGATYRFEIETSRGMILSETRVPEAVEIESVEFDDKIQDINLGEYGFPASVTFTDPGNQTNYYALEVFVDDCQDGCSEQGITGELNELLVENLKVNTSGNTDVNIVSGPEGIDGVRYVYLSDNGFDGNTFTLNFFIIPSLIDVENPANAIVHFVLKTITRDHYLYLLTSDYQKQIEEEGTLAEPVQVYTNIHQGLGLFAGYDVSVASITLRPGQ